MPGEPIEREVDPQQQIRHMAGVLKRGWLPILTCLGIGVLIGVALYFFLPKSYMSTAKLVMRSSWMFEAVGEARAMDELPFSARARLLEDELRSSVWVEAVLDKLEWPEWARAKSRDDMTQRLFVQKVKDQITCRVTSGELGERLVIVNFAWFDRVRARDFCAKLVDHWLSSSITQYGDEIERRLAIAQERLLAKRAELDAARLDLENFEQRNGINALNQHQDDQQRYDMLGIDLDQTIAQIAGLQAQVDAFDRQLNATDAKGIPLLPPTLPEESLISNDEKANRLIEIERVYSSIKAYELRGYTLKWPPLKSLHLELARLLEETSALPDSVTVATPPVANPKYDVVKAQRDAASITLEGLLASKERMQSERTKINEVLETLPQILRQQSALNTEILTKQQIVFDQSLQIEPLKDKRAVLDRKGNQGLLPYTSLEPPVPAPAPQNYIGWLALAISTMVGLAAAILAVLGKELLRSSFTHAEQLRRTLRLPVLGEVAPIQTALEARRARFQRLLQVAASLTLLIGLSATIWVCITSAEKLPPGLVQWFLDKRDVLF